MFWSRLCSFGRRGLSQCGGGPIGKGVFLASPLFLWAAWAQSMCAVPLCVAVGLRPSQSRLKPSPSTDFFNHLLYCYKSIPPPEGEHEALAKPSTTAVRRSLPATANQATADCKLAGVLHSNSLASLVPLLHSRTEAAAGCSSRAVTVSGVVVLGCKGPSPI